MDASIHAVAVLATLVAHLIVLVFSHMARPQSRLFIVQAGVVIAVGMLFQLTMSIHGAPLAEWLFPVGGLGVCAYIKKQRASKVLGWFLVIAAVVLCNTSMALRMTERYTSDPDCTVKAIDARQFVWFLTVKKGLAQQYAPDKVLPEGPIGNYDRGELAYLWHTPITGLRAIRSVPGEIWYPGGPVAEGSSHLEWREKK